MIRHLRLVLAGALALSLAAPTAASARPLLGTDAAATVTVEAAARADAGLHRAATRAAARLHVTTSDRPHDRPADRPSDRPADRPSDRPDDRPNDRPGDAAHERVETFPIGQIGQVTLAWTPRHVRVEDVRFEEGWRHEVRQASPQRLAVGFTDGEACGAFAAWVHGGELHTELHRRDCEPDVRTETFAVGDVGMVEVAWTSGALRVQHVEAAEGWRHQTHQQHRGKATVGFTDGRTCILFTVWLTDEGPQTHTERRACDDRPHTTDRPERDGEAHDEERDTVVDRTRDASTA